MEFQSDHMEWDEAYKFICKTANYYYRRSGGAIPINELVNEGYLAFKKAEDTFDPSFGIPFYVFAKICLVGYILSYVRTQLIPLGFRNIKSKGAQKLDYNKFIYIPYDEGESEDHLMIYERLNLATTEKALVESILLDREEHRLIRELVQGLPFRYMTVTIGRYWWQQTLEDMASKTGLTKERIRQMLIQVNYMVKLLLDGKEIPRKHYRKETFENYINELPTDKLTVK